MTEMSGELGFTPGPYHVSGNHGYGDLAGHAIRDGRGFVIAVTVTDIEPLEQDSLFNAQLFAAAPELYEALKELWTYAQGLEGIIRNGVYRSEELKDPNAWLACDDFAYNGEGASMRDQVEAALRKGASHA